MVNLFGPNQYPRKDPYEDLKVQRIEEEKFDKEKKEPALESKPSPKKPYLWAAVTLLFHKLFSFFSKEEAQTPDVYLTLELENLCNLHSYFEKMKENNLSGDMEFLQKFSLLWHKFIEDTFRLKKLSPLYKEIEFFIEEIQSYPEDSDHSFGYYLSEYAGSEWLPYPFLQLFQKLFEEHLQNKDRSHLEKWTSHLKILIDHFKEDAPEDS